MKTSFLMAITALTFMAFSAEARLQKYPAEQGNRYITTLSAIGKNQVNYQEFKKVLASLNAQGYQVDPTRMDFYAETVQQTKHSKSQVHDWIDFAIEVNFLAKNITRDGIVYRRGPFLRALGTAQEVCDNEGQNCATPTEVNFTSYELGWYEVPNLGGGTSSAGSK